MKQTVIALIFLLTGTLVTHAQDYDPDQLQPTQKEKDSIQALSEKMRALSLQPRKKPAKDSEEYKRLYNKAREMELARQQGPAYKENTKLYGKFLDNLNQKLDQYNYSTQYLFFEWIEKNISSTNFSSVDSAKEDWIRLDASRKKETAENRLYMLYSTEMLLTYENYSEIMSSAMTDVMMEQFKK